MLKFKCFSFTGEPSDTKAPIEEKTIEAIDKVFDLCSAVNERLPWNEFKKVLPEFDKHINEYSEKSASMVANIKTNIMNAIDAYSEASRHITEWSSLNIPILQAHLKLFSDYSAVKANAQNGLLQKLLDDGVVRTKIAQAELEKISTNLDAADHTISDLSNQFKIDFVEGNEFFRSKLARSKKRPELKERFSNVLNLYKRLGVLIQQSLIDITSIEDEMRTQIGDIRNESEKLDNFETIVDDPEVLDSTVKATKNLIAKCSEYVTKHHE